MTHHPDQHYTELELEVHSEEKVLSDHDKLMLAYEKLHQKLDLMIKQKRKKD